MILSKDEDRIMLKFLYYKVEVCAEYNTSIHKNIEYDIECLLT